jgi:hypothetical protein
MKRRAERRVRLLVATALMSGLLAACTSPSLFSQSCGRLPNADPVLTTLSAHLRVDASLRNGEVVPGPRGQRFVSAEMHRAGDAFGVPGKILTWVGDGATSFRSVDRNARALSSWPAARDVDLRNAAARTSRGCVYPLRGHRVCDTQSAVNAPVAATGSECQSATTTTRPGA